MAKQRPAEPDVTDNEERIQALEAAVQQLTHVVLSTGGSERAWQMATLGILGAVAPASGVGSAISEKLEAAHQSMVSAGVAQAHVEGFCNAGRAILEAIQIGSTDQTSSSLH